MRHEANENGVMEPAEAGFYWYRDRHGAWAVARAFSCLDMREHDECCRWAAVGEGNGALICWRELGAHAIVGPLEPAGMTPRDRLLKLLRDYADGKGPSESEAHRRAEDALLELVGDEEITKAWSEAADLWWYA